MNFLLGALFGFSTAIGGIWWLLYLLGGTMWKGSERTAEAWPERAPCALATLPSHPSFLPKRIDVVDRALIVTP